MSENSEGMSQVIPTKKTATTSKKYYSDKFQSVLATKCHLDSFINGLGKLTKKETQNIEMPIIRLMSMTWYIDSLRLVDKDVYVLDHVYQFICPRTIKQIRWWGGGIDKMIEALAMLEVYRTSKESRKRM